MVYLILLLLPLCSLASSSSRRIVIDSVYGNFKNEVSSYPRITLFFDSTQPVLPLKKSIHTLSLQQGYFSSTTYDYYRRVSFRYKRVIDCDTVKYSLRDENFWGVSITTGDFANATMIQIIPKSLYGWYPHYIETGVGAMVALGEESTSGAGNILLGYRFQMSYFMIKVGAVLYIWYIPVEENQTIPIGVFPFPYVGIGFSF